MDKVRARRLWLAAQRLDRVAPFGAGPEATQAAVEHLGYVQIDTINVIERAHHHILYTRIPAYRRAHLRQAQSVDKTIFECWTHALSYVPTRDMHFFVASMKAHRKQPNTWFGHVSPEDLRKVLRLIDEQGPLTIRDFADEVLVEKQHPWASRKPSKAALQVGFYNGQLAVAERSGMLKTYDLVEHHFGWAALPKPATERQRLAYLVDRTLRAQGLVSLESICHLEAASKPGVRTLIEARVKRGDLTEVAIESAERLQFWATPETLAAPDAEPEHTHILSPFDPLVIQRKRLELMFGYAHRFEAYVPKEKRVFGYFTLPVLVGDEIVAALDLKTDRAQRTLLVQAWHWVGMGNARTHKRKIEEELGRFERFQLED